MSNRRVIYNKNFEGSPYRTLGGSGLSGGKKPKKRGFSTPSLPSFPHITISIHPDYAQWLPAGTAWQALQQWLIPGAATPSSWVSSAKRTAKSIHSIQWAEFFFKDTVFTNEFIQQISPIFTEPRGMSSEEYYYHVANINGNLANTPPPTFYRQSIFGANDLHDSLRREFWDIFNSPTYWDLDPNND